MWFIRRPKQEAASLFTSWRATTSVAAGSHQNWMEEKKREREFSSTRAAPRTVTSDRFGRLHQWCGNGDDEQMARPISSEEEDQGQADFRQKWTNLDRAVPN